MSSKWWTHSWNPVIGCTPASPGCDHCYAKKLHDQRHAAFVAGSRIPACYAQPFEQVTCLEERLARPLGWKKPRRVFVNSMSDLFHENVPDSFLDKIFAYMALAPRHTFMLLTKRPQRMREYLLAHDSASAWANWLSRVAYNLTGSDDAECACANAINGCLGEGHNVGWPMSNVWLGVTVEHPDYYWRIRELPNTPAARRFVSVEPMLGPVDLHDGLWTTSLDITDEYESCPREPRIDWVICGGESGPGARPMHPDWARSLRDQCEAAGVPFFFKQWGELVWLPVPAEIPHGKSVFCHVRRAFIGQDDALGSTYNPDGLYASRSRRAGRLLDGIEHNAMPEVQS